MGVPWYTWKVHGTHGYTGGPKRPMADLPMHGWSMGQHDKPMQDSWAVHGRSMGDRTAVPLSRPIAKTLYQWLTHGRPKERPTGGPWVTHGWPMRQLYTYILGIWYPRHCGQSLCLSMLVEVVTLWADDRREAEDNSVLQRWLCDAINTARRWPTNRYINHRVHRSPDDGSFPEVIGHIGYHANPEKSTKEWGRRTSYERTLQQ